MTGHTKINWATARRNFEEQGMSLAAIARKHGVTATAVQNHKKAEGWTRSDIVADLPAETVNASFAPEQTAPAVEIPQLRQAQRIAELERQLAEAERKITSQTAELDKHRPTHEVHLYTSADEVRAFFGEERLYEIAGLALADQNKARVKRGLPPFDYEHNQGMYEREIAGILDELLARRTKWIDPNQRVRVVKMAHKQKDGSWSLRQIPVEVQIGNEAGQSGAMLWRQRDKGFKLVQPYLCQRMNCWQEAAVGPDKRFVYAGYCSSECMASDPYLNKQPVPGVATSRAVAM